jgi:uncharacterized membrane protein YdjX (TVP38/TMEM64 family)
MKSWQQSLILPLVMLGTVLVFVVTPLGTYLQQALDYLKSGLESWGPWAPLGYILVKALGTGLGLPAAPLTMLAGALFGALGATLWTTIGAGIGATVAFTLARYLLRSWVEARFNLPGLVTRMNQGLAEKGFWYVLSSRLTPFLPFNILNYLFGLSSVAPKTYIVATFVGIIPLNACYSWFGESVGRIAQSKEVYPKELLPAFVALTGLALLTLIPTLLNRKKPAS